MTLEVREALGGEDPAIWLSQMEDRLSAVDAHLLPSALGVAIEHFSGQHTAQGEPWLPHGQEVVRILAGVRMDAETLAAGLLGGLPALLPDFAPVVQERVGAPVARLLEGAARMEQIQALRAQASSALKPAQQGAQLEALRKMLLAMVQDVRVVVIKLAAQTQSLRYLAGHGDERARAAAARDTFDLFAPLANRLGIWQLKWELEDLALRCSDPQAYRGIARELDEKRADRERFISEVTATLRDDLVKAGVAGEVSGRPKHIYSIYKKLTRKDSALRELSDIRGVRVLVNDIKDCYAVLGLVHNLWTPLPGEFDDYIAKPKPNNYQSLHTAVVGPDGKVLEVQIRSHEMHQHCEYGVAAHWRYKEGGRPRASGRAGANFDQRIAWLRQILEWKEGLSAVTDLAEHFRTGLSDEAVYVLTPQGRVIDLPRGATPVDFAYHVHSDLGHRCRGAHVDGDIVPLTYALENGQTVEIIATKSGGPSRDWLNAELGYIHSQRARTKVRQWFNSQNLEAAIGQGRQVAEKLLQREGRTALGLEPLAGQLGFAKVEEFLAAVGRGELGQRQLHTALHVALGEQPPSLDEPLANLPRFDARSIGTPGRGDILIVGVDQLLTVLAKCCKPAPPDPIVGFVTRGRGVTVHRSACANIGRLAAERLIAAQWGERASRGEGEGRFAVDIEVEGSSHPQLMRDILDLFSREKSRVLAATTHSRDPDARLLFTLEVSTLDQLRRLLRQIGELPGVTLARRR